MKKICLLLVTLFAALSFAIAQPPTLGNYPATSLIASGNITVLPIGVPTNSSSIVAYTTTSFKGTMQVDTATGKITITNAYPAGTYPITVKAFNGTESASTTFTLTITNVNCNSSITAASASLNAGSYPYAIAIADYNGDGIQDFATINSSYRYVAIRLGNGTGSFTNTDSIYLSGTLISIVATDFNGDGKQDLAATVFSSNAVCILMGDGTGHFTVNNYVSIGVNTFGLAKADFNRDGRMDLVCSNINDNSASILLSNGNGQFATTTLPNVGTTPRFVATGDFNNDGNPDFVTANNGNATLSIRLGNGTGGFTAASAINVTYAPESVAIADFNNDGKQDFISISPTYSIATVKFGNGAGGFQNTNNVSVGVGPNYVTIGDFNGDGYSDFATANTTGNTLSLRFATGADAFTSIVDLPAGSKPWAIATGDFNSDGRQDILSTNVDSPNIIRTGVSAYVRLGGSSNAVVIGNNILIANNDSTPTLSDLTDFGTTSSLTRSYTIRNSGTSGLTINSISLNGGDSLLFTKGPVSLPLIVAPDSAITFTIRFVPTGTGLKKTTVNINTSDCNNSPFRFAIQGTGVLITPVSGGYTTTTIPTAGSGGVAVPVVTPVNATGFTAFTSTDFKGSLHVDSLTGKVFITNAHPAGTYIVTVKSFNGASSATTTFTLVVGGTLCSKGNFSGSVNNNYPASTAPRAIAIADLNNDGRLDIATGSQITNLLSIRLGDGAGGFGPLISTTVGSVPNAIAIADFNSDGRQDLVVATASAASVSVVFGNGAGGFIGTTTVATGNGPYSVAVGDFNNDGKPDFVTANASTVSLRLGDGIGNFSSPPDITVGSSPSSIVVGDFNNDGNADFATTNTLSANVSVRLGDGAGNFTSAANIPAGTQPVTVVTGNFNADNNQDLLVANQSSSTIMVLLGSGNGSFTAAAPVTTPNIPLALGVGDFNGDGKQDFIVTINGTSNVSVRLGNGTGSFTMGQTIATASNPRSIAIGDFDNNGIQDFVTANAGNGTASIRLGARSNIVVQGNNISIPNGSTIPDSSNGTYFGSTPTTATLSRTFYLQNTGSDTLRITGTIFTGGDSTNFIKFGFSTLPIVLPPGSAQTFIIDFSSTDGGLKTTRFHLFNDDCTKTDFDFTISAKAVCTRLSADNFWLGNTINWNENSNWSLGIVPDGCGRAVVNAGVPFMPQISTQASCYSLTLNNGATFTVTGAGRLTITGP